MAGNVLVGDIGGTKTVLAIVSQQGGPRIPLVQQSFASSNYPSLEAVVRDFLAGNKMTVTRASFGVAGPIVGNRARVTNLPWIIDAHVLSQTLHGAPVHLLNDLESIAYSIPILQAADLHVLNTGQRAERGALAVIAPGTGLGEAFLAWSHDRYQAYPSEGGHADFAPMNPLQIDLLSYLLPRFGHVSYERVCSGLGIPNLYAFLKDTKRADEPEWLSQQLATVSDPTPIIVQAALENRADICNKTLDLFVSILAGEAGNLALKVLATGGVYLGGGIPPRILSRLERPGFMESFAGKGRLGALLEHVPVHVILNPNAALLGVAAHGLAAP